MPRITKELRDEQLAYCAECMVRLRSSHEVTKSCVRKYGVHPRTVRAWMKAVRAMRRAEASTIDIENRRDAMRDSLDLVARLAIERTTVVKNEDGTVAMTTVTRPDGSVVQTPTVRQNPDLQRYLHACRELVHLDGLAQPFKAEVDLTGDLTVMPDMSKMGKTAAKALGEFLKEIAPEGDVGKLAGEWFKFSGEDPKP